MSTTQQKPVLRVVTHRNNVYPLRSEDYKAFAAAFAPSTVISSNVYALLCDLKFSDYEIKEYSLRSVQRRFFDVITDEFLSDDHNRKVTIESGYISLETSGASPEVSNKTLDEVCDKLVRYFRRWGYSFTSDIVNNKNKRTATYSFKVAENPPVMNIDGATVDQYNRKKIDLIMGFTKIEFEPDVDIVHAETSGHTNLGIRVNVYTKAGDGWTKVHSSTCLYSQVGSIRETLNLLTSLA